MSDHAKQVKSRNSKEFRVMEQDVAAAGSSNKAGRVQTTMEIATEMSRGNTKPAMKSGNSS